MSVSNQSLSPIDFPSRKKSFPFCFFALFAEQRQRDNILIIILLLPKPNLSSDRGKDFKKILQSEFPLGFLLLCLFCSCLSRKSEREKKNLKFKYIEWFSLYNLNAALPKMINDCLLNFCIFSRREFFFLVTEKMWSVLTDVTIPTFILYSSTQTERHNEDFTEKNCKIWRNFERGRTGNRRSCVKN